MNSCDRCGGRAAQFAGPLEITFRLIDMSDPAFAHLARHDEKQVCSVCIFAQQRPARGLPVVGREVAL